MLYSIGKDSSVMVRLAQKAFHPGAAAVPAAARRHDVEVPRDDRVPRRVLPRARPRLIVHTNRGARSARAQSRSTAGSKKYTDVMKTQALLQALDRRRLRRGLRRRPARRGEIARQGARLLVPRPLPPVGSEEPAARAVEPVQRQGQQGREHPRLPALELDRARRLAVHPPREDPHRPAVLRRAATGRRARRHPDHGRRRAAAARNPARSRRRASSASARSAATPSPAPSSRPRRRCPRSSRRCCSPGPPSGRAA